MYQVEFRPQAAREFEGLETTGANRILKKLHRLAENYESIRPEALTGPFSGFYKFRVGAYGSCISPTVRSKS